MVIDYKNFDEKMRDAFDEFEVRPPAHVWYGVVAGMSAPRKKRMLPVLLRVAAAAAVLVVTSLSFWFLASQPFGKAPRELLSQAPSAGGMPQALPLEESRMEAAATPGLSPEGSASSTKVTPVLQDRPEIPASPNLNGPQSLLASLSTRRPGLLSPDRGRDSEIPLFGQLSESLALINDGKDLSMLSLGLHFSPQYSFRHIVNPYGFSYGGIPFEKLEDPIFTYSLGLSVQARLKPWLSLQTGLNYGTMGQFVSNINAYSHPKNLPLYEVDSNIYYGHPQTIVTSLGNIRLNEPTLYFADAESYRVITNKQFIYDDVTQVLKYRDFGLSQYFTYLEVPLLARMNAGSILGVGFEVKAGGSVNYVLGNEVFLGRKSLATPIGETYGQRRFNYSALGGLAVTIPLGSHLRLNLEPTAQVFIRPMVPDQLTLGRALPFHYSVFTGITYGF